MSAFRDLIEGGIERPSLITLFGEPGTAKVFIAIDFIFEGLKHDQTCVYICRDHPVESVRRSMKVFGDIEGYEKDGKLIFVDAFTGRFGQSKGEYFIEDPYDLCLYNGLLSLLSRNEKIDRLVFDSVSVIIAKPEDAVRLLKRFYGFIEESNCLGLFIGVEGGLYKELEVTLSSSSDVSLHTYRNGNENFIRLERMRARPHNHPEAKVVVGKEGVKMYRI